MPRHPTPRRAAALAVAALVALIAACGGGSDDEDDASPITTTETTQVTPDEPTAETTTAAEGPPEWVDVARDLQRRVFALQTDPDLDRLADVYAETCECWDRARTTIQFLADRNQRIEGRAPEVRFVRHEATDEQTGLVNLTVMGESTDLRRVSADGDVVEEIPAVGQGCVAYSVRADGPDGAWRIYGETSLPECPEEAL
jgi:hypothetical protein